MNKQALFKTRPADEIKKLKIDNEDLRHDIARTLQTNSELVTENENLRNKGYKLLFFISARAKSSRLRSPAETASEEHLQKELQWVHVFIKQHITLNIAELQNVRRILDRGIRMAQSPPRHSRYIDIFQHALDCLETAGLKPPKEEE